MNIRKMYSTIDTHVAGEAFRMIIHSPIVLNEESISKNNARLQTKFKNEMKILLNEPRGHSDMNGCIILPSKVADYGLLFLNDSDRSEFKYSGLIATITTLIETGNIEVTENGIYTIETVEGIYEVKTTIENGEVVATYIESDLCFVEGHEQGGVAVSIDQKREYVLFQLPEEIPEIHMNHLIQIQKWGKEAATRISDMKENLCGIVLIESSHDHPNEVRSITFRRDGTILRSPGFDSTYAILASLRSKCKAIKHLTNTSIFNSTLTAHQIIEDRDEFSITTEGFIMGSHEFIVDQDDPFQSGFILK